MTTSPIELLFDLSEFEHAQAFEGCQYPWEVLNHLQDYLKQIPLGQIHGSVPKEAYLVHPELISIGKGSLVEPGAYIKGPCIIGENCTIRHGAYIRGNVIIGNNCVIGHDTEIKNSLCLNKAQAAHFAYVGDSILGNGVNLGAGVKLANVRLDHLEVKVIFENSKIASGRRKLGSLLGDNTQIGCNCVANPGTITGKGVKCYPSLNFGGFIPENALIKSIQPLIIA